MEDKNLFRFSPPLLMGIVVIFVGVVFMLGNLNILDSQNILRFWPAAFIILGVYMMLTAGELTGAITGVLIAMMGFLILANSLGYLHFRLKDFWPLLLVLAGVNMALQAMQSKRRSGDSDNTITGFGILSGFNRSCNSPDFHGGELSAFMGGGELDLRRASIRADQAVLSVYAIMGGFKIYVPADWTVTCKVFPFMGGVDDKTLASQSGAAKRLIIKGYVIMGGVEIHN
jgi:predicted membrane protein